MDKSAHILKEIKKAVLSVDADAELILFGSRARGDYNEESDWDLLVLSTQIVNGKLKSQISESLFYIELNNSAIITPVIINKEKWYHKFNRYPLFYEVQRDGKAI